MDPRTSVPEKVNCEICLKEIPPSEANSAEAQDYLLYFCGLECYAEWQKRSERVSLAD